MKKLLLLLIAVLTMSFALTGCNESFTPPAYENGEVKSGNGTFAVEKGDYVYFVNGVGDMDASNAMGDVTKGALVRVKTADIGSENANVEMVIPKFANTSSVVSGIYIYGDTVYYATPYDGKDKTGKVRSDYTDFRTFNLKTGKSNQILFESKKVSEYAFLSNSNGVFLAYETTETVDSKEVKAFNVYNASGSKIFSVDNYTSLAIADNNADKVFYTKLAYSEELKQDEGFSEVYSYTVGATSADVVFSGCGENAKVRDGRDNASYTAKILKYSALSGAKITIVKYTGEILVMKLSSNDANLSTYYFGLELKNGLEVDEDVKELGISNSYTDAAITASSYYKSLDEIYYLEDTTNLKGLVKFNYNNLNDVYHGRTQVCDDAAGYNIAFENDGYLYLSGTASDYYRIKLDGSNELQKITAVGAKSLTEWFVPRVIGDNFICAYSDAIFQNYVYSIDMTKVDEDYIENYKELDRDKVTELIKTMLGKKTDGDKSSFDSLLDSTYPEEDEE